jgi:hypothetical protein
MTDRSDAVYRWTEQSIRQDHAAYVDVNRDSADRPGPISEPEPSSPDAGRPAWANRGR